MSDDAFTLVTVADTTFEVDHVMEHYDLTDYQAKIMGVFSQAAETRRRYAKKPRVLKQMRDDVADYVKAHPGRQMGAGEWYPATTWFTTTVSNTTNSSVPISPTFKVWISTEEI